MEKLTIQEEQAMQVIWKTGEGNIKLFLDNMEGAKAAIYHPGLNRKEPRKKGTAPKPAHGQYLFIPPGGYGRGL